jgi:hypothetical protein
MADLKCRARELFETEIACSGDVEPSWVSRWIARDRQDHDGVSLCERHRDEHSDGMDVMEAG